MTSLALGFVTRKCSNCGGERVVYDTGDGSLGEETGTRNRHFDPDAMAGIGTHEIVAGLVDPPAGPVLEVGPGQGAFTARLANTGYRALAIGVEAKQYTAIAPFIQADIDRGLPVKTASLEGIVAIEVIEHLENPLWFFREARRCLVSEGWLIVTTPNVQSVAARLSVLLRGHFTYFGETAYRSNGHISPVTLQQVNWIAERCGLVAEEVTYNVGKLPIPRVRHRFPLRSPLFRNSLLGECVIVRLRKSRPPARTITRG